MTCVLRLASLFRNWELHAKNKEQRAFETVDVARIQVSG